MAIIVNMSDTDAAQMSEIAQKISELVQDKGWNQERFAHETGLNRQTVRKILNREEIKLRNSTLAACANALGLKVHELRDHSIDRLRLRVLNKQTLVPDDDVLNKVLEHVTQPELHFWIERNPERSRSLTTDEWHELLQMQGEDGALRRIGAEHFVQHMERRRELVHKVKEIANEKTFLDTLEQLVDLIHEKIQPPIHPY